MASMTIRNIDDQLKIRLRIQAAIHGRSMEDEARDILRAALSAEPVRGQTLYLAGKVLNFDSDAADAEPHDI